MAEQAISCPSCGKKIPLTRALRAEIESSVKEQYEEALEKRERELRVRVRAAAESRPGTRRERGGQGGREEGQPGTRRAEGTAERPVKRARGEAEARARHQEART